MPAISERLLRLQAATSPEEAGYDAGMSVLRQHGVLADEEGEDGTAADATAAAAALMLDVEAAVSVHRLSDELSRSGWLGELGQAVSASY